MCSLSDERGFHSPSLHLPHIKHSAVLVFGDSPDAEQPPFRSRPPSQSDWTGATSGYLHGERKSGDHLV